MLVIKVVPLLAKLNTGRGKEICRSSYEIKPADDRYRHVLSRTIVANLDFPMKNGTYRLVLEYRRTKVPLVLQSTSCPWDLVLLTLPSLGLRELTKPFQLLYAVSY